MIEYIVNEMKKQPSILKDSEPYRLWRATDGSVLAGAGDSYAASKAAYYLSRGKVLCFDSHSVVSRPEICAGKDVFFVSVSGATKSNIEAAERVSGIARRRIAVTSNMESPLAKLCDEVIRIPYNAEHRLPGILSFSLTLQILIRLAGLDESIDYLSTWNEAQSYSLPVVSERGTTFMLGQDFLYPIALYASFKLYEFFGAKAQTFPVEDFMHAALFSLKKRDTVNIFCYSDPCDVVERFVNGTRGKNLVKLLPHEARNEAETVFFFTFVSQRFAVETALKKEISVPYYMAKKSMLKLSSSLIY